MGIVGNVYTSFAKKIEQLVQTGNYQDLRNALINLENFINTYNLDRHKREILMLRSQFEQLVIDKRKGEISRDEVNLERNQLVSKLLFLKEDIRQYVDGEEEHKGMVTPNKKHLFAIITLLTILVSLTIINSWENIWQNTQPSPIISLDDSSETLIDTLIRIDTIKPKPLPPSPNPKPKPIPPKSDDDTHDEQEIIPTPPIITITGFLFDAEYTSQPIKGVKVFLEQNPAIYGISNEDGLFQLKGSIQLEAGADVRLICQKKGYQSTPTNTVRLHSAKASLGSLYLEKRKPKVVDIFIKDEGDNVLEGVEVQLGYGGEIVKSDRNGHVRYHINDADKDKFYLKFFHPKYESKILKGGYQPEIDIILKSLN